MEHVSAIHRFVEQARRGELPRVIARVMSGWAVLGDPQILPGYCLLLPDPVVPDLNALRGSERQQFLDDMARLGDAVLAVTGAERINYEILGNVEPALHAHVIPRSAREPAEPGANRCGSTTGAQPRPSIPWLTASCSDGSHRSSRPDRRRDRSRFYTLRKSAWEQTNPGLRSGVCIDIPARSHNALSRTRTRGEMVNSVIGSCKRVNRMMSFLHNHKVLAVSGLGCLLFSAAAGAQPAAPVTWAPRRHSRWSVGPASTNTAPDRANGDLGVFPGSSLPPSPPLTLHPRRRGTPAMRSRLGPPLMLPRPLTIWRPRAATPRSRPLPASTRAGRCHCGRLLFRYAQCADQWQRAAHGRGLLHLQGGRHAHDRAECSGELLERHGRLQGL